jgi:hypothetical protein
MPMSHHTPTTEQITIRGLHYGIRHWGDPDAPLVFFLHGWMDSSATFQFVVDALKSSWRRSWGKFTSMPFPFDGTVLLYCVQFFPNALQGEAPHLCQPFERAITCSVSLRRFEQTATTYCHQQCDCDDLALAI